MNPPMENSRTRTVHLQEPDFERPIFDFSPEKKQRIRSRLAFIYGKESADANLAELERICRIYHAHKPKDLVERDLAFDPDERFTEKDIILITYGDLIQGNGRSPLASLGEFCRAYLGGAINTLHILPFFPYSSDRGFFGD